MMKQETKDSIYMILDLLDSISRTSKNNPAFIKIEESKLKDVKNELLELLNTSSEDWRKENINKKTELIGSLPTVLANREKFPKNEDIAKLAQKSLNYEPPSWRTRSRDAIIGMIIDEISKRDDEALGYFFNAWNKFLIKNKGQNYLKYDKKGFVDIWLEFFDHYSGGKR